MIPEEDFLEVCGEVVEKDQRIKKAGLVFCFEDLFAFVLMSVCLFVCLLVCLLKTKLADELAKMMDKYEQVESKALEYALLLHNLCLSLLIKSSY